MGSDEPPQKKLKGVENDSDDSEDESNDYQIREVSRSVARRYGMEIFNFEAQILTSRLRNRRLLDVSDSLRSMFNEVLARAGRHYAEEDRLRLHIEHAGLDVPVVIHAQAKHNVTADTVLDR